MQERRKSERIECRLRCELATAYGRATVTILDVSEAGLSVHATLRADVGDSVRVRIRAPGGEVKLDALVWGTPKPDQPRLRLVLSESPPEYLRLLKRLADKTASGAREASESAPTPEEPVDGVDRSFRVRLQQISSLRTRTIDVVAKSIEDAKMQAFADSVRLGGMWRVIEVAES